MITLAEMEDRVKALLSAVENSVKEHHLLVGQAREAEAILAFMKSKNEEIVADSAVEASTEKAIDGVLA